jgi:hypothetical protein
VVFGAVVHTFDGGGGHSPQRAKRLPHLLPQADDAVAGLLYVAPEPAVSLAAQRWESPASRRAPEGVKPHPEAAADALLAKHGELLPLPSLVAVLLASDEDALRQLEQQGALSDEAITSLFAKLEDGLRNHVLNGQRKALRAYQSRYLNKAGPAHLARIVLDCRDMPGLPWIKR